MDESRGKKLDEMLLLYQQMAMKSLAGPSAAWRPSSKLRFPLNGNQMLINNGLTIPPPKKLGELPFDFTLPLPFSLPTQLPLLMQADSSREAGELIRYELENISIAGFEIGGEERLCLPPILNTILKAVDIQIINEAFDELQIQCPNCSTHQLRLLKQEGILPDYVMSAGLIRKTDAERLCTRLLHPNMSPITDIDQRNYPQVNNTCLPIYHECFGEAHGFLYTELYTHAYAKCIACADCEKLFSMERFVTHSHFNQENRICHWGFNRRNWRSYVLLSDDVIDDSDMLPIKTAFEQVLDKFKNSRKRKTAAQAASTAAPSEVTEERPVTIGAPQRVTSIQNLNSASPTTKRRCNRAPMKAYEYVKGEPTLENPDCVVPHTETHKYGKHYVPNICLKMAPPTQDSESKVSSDDVTDDAAPLDLRSPTQRERYNSTCSSVCQSEAEQHSPIAVQLTRDITAESKVETTTDEAEEEIDVDSTPDDEELSSPQPALSDVSMCSPDPNPVLVVDDGSASRATPTILTTCLDQLEAMFLNVVESSTLSEEARSDQKESYMTLLKQVKNNINNVSRG